MSQLIEIGTYLPLFGLGPVMPAEKSLILLVGDGYIVGYFVASVILPDLLDLGPSIGRLDHEKETETKAEIERRRGGILAALVFALVWLVGQIQAPEDYPLAPADHHLFGALPLLGIGMMLAALSAPLAARRVHGGQDLAFRRLRAQYHFGEHKGLLWGGLLASLYAGVWLMA